MRKTLLTLFIALGSFLCCLGQESTYDLEVTELTTNIFVYTTYKELGGVPFPSNGLYVVTEEGVVLIDTPWDPVHYQTLLDTIEDKHNKPVVLCLSTHWHEDRTGGLSYYREQDIKTCTSHRTHRILEENQLPTAEFLFATDTTFQVGGRVFRAFFPGKVILQTMLWSGLKVKNYSMAVA